jgi:hypothetical protein
VALNNAIMSIKPLVYKTDLSEGKKCYCSKYFQGKKGSSIHSGAGYLKSVFETSCLKYFVMLNECGK